MNGRELRRKRVEAGLSQELLGRELGWDRTKMSRIEQGFMELKPEDWARVAAALDGLIAKKKQVQQAAEAAGWPAQI